ncbi:MAG: PEP-CTERM sorting domain-containing protein, partial [Rhizobacter sp.]
MSLRPHHALRTLAAVTALVAATAAPTVASAAATQWFFSGVTFTDGASAEGSFFFDGTTFSDWSVQSYRLPGAPGFPEVTPYDYTVSSSTFSTDGYGITFNRNDSGPGNFFSIYFNGALGANGGSTTAWAWERTESFGGSVNSHSSTADFTVASASLTDTVRSLPVTVAAPVPEPETYAMLVLGALMVGGVARRTQRAGR